MVHTSIYSQLLRQPPLHRPNRQLLLPLRLPSRLPVQRELARPAPPPATKHRRQRLITQIVRQLRACDMAPLEPVKVLDRGAPGAVARARPRRIEELREQREVGPGQQPLRDDDVLVCVDEVAEGARDAAERYYVAPGCAADDGDEELCGEEVKVGVCEGGGGTAGAHEAIAVAAVRCGV